MRLNENTKIIGNNVILIPYESKHVEKYHEWMKDPELQELTASEPLNLDEEYEMQKSWRDDEYKCTFLILSKKIYEQTNDEIQSLIGDTNIYLSNECNFDDNLVQENNKKIQIIVGEVGIMIAEKNERGKHYGWEAMLLMFKYGYKMIKINKFIAKINKNNIKSINMFKKMQFIVTAVSDVFEEITLEKCINHDWINWIEEQIKYVKFVDYDDKK